MRTVSDVSTDDLVNNLLNSVATESTTTDSVSSSQTTNSTSSAVNSDNVAPGTNSDSSLLTTKAPVPTTVAPVASVPTTPAPGDAARTSEDKDSGGAGAGLSIGIAVGILALVAATLLFLRSRRNRTQKKLEPVISTSSGPGCPAVPADRGFKKERELGMPEMSIELSPGHLGNSKGFNMSFASSTRSSVASNKYNSSEVSSTDGSLFNTKGGVSPTFSNRKMTSYSYQYRSSEEATNPNLAASTTFHLTGLIGNGQGGNATSLRAPANRKLSTPDEYAELVSATNAHGKVVGDSSNPSPQGMRADFTSGAADNHSFLAPLPPRTTAPPTRLVPHAARPSEESMCPDSPMNGLSKRAFGMNSNMLGESSTSSRSSGDDICASSTASFMTESSISSALTDSFATTMSESANVSSMASQLKCSSAGDSDYSDDKSSRCSSASSASTMRSGSLIALNLDAKEGSSEIAI